GRVVEELSGQLDRLLEAVVIQLRLASVKFVFLRPPVVVRRAQLFPRRATESVAARTAQLAAAFRLWSAHVNGCTVGEDPVRVAPVMPDLPRLFPEIVDLLGGVPRDEFHESW